MVHKGKRGSKPPVKSDREYEAEIALLKSKLSKSDNLFNAVKEISDYPIFNWSGQYHVPEKLFENLMSIVHDLDNKNTK